MSQAYYSQWQRFPKPTKDWQREENRIFSEGRLFALRYVVNTSKTVLDVGCGIGLDYQPLSNVEYFGVDVTPKFIQEAKRNKVPCQLASALSLPFRDGSFETVYCRNLLLHLPPDQMFKALDEMFRVAKRQVVTVEPAWQQEPDYRVRELIDNNPEDILLFFSNTYGQSEMEDYTKTKNVEVHWKRGHDKDRSSFLHRPVDWQVTVYRKN